jgi:hypothetical protein
MQIDNATTLDRKSGVPVRLRGTCGTMMIGFRCFPNLMAKAMVGAPPGFPVWLGGIKELLRLSLQKAAHANMGGAAYRKSGSPHLFVPRTLGRT